jgi:hypothetical protein
MPGRCSVGAVETHAWVGAGNWKHAAEPTIAAVNDVVALLNFMVLLERNENDDLLSK